MKVKEIYKKLTDSIARRIEVIIKGGHITYSNKHCKFFIYNKYVNILKLPLVQINLHKTVSHDYVLS